MTKSYQAALRIAFGAAIVIILAMASILLALQAAMSLAVREQIDAQLAGELVAIDRLYRSEGFAAVAAALDHPPGPVDAGAPLRALLTADGTLAAGNVARPSALPPAGRAVSLELRPVGATETRPTRAALLILPDGTRALVARDVQEQLHFEHTLFVENALAALVAGVLAGILCYILSRRYSRRVGEAVAACESVGAGDDSRRWLVSTRGDDFDRLAHAVNRMLERLATSARQMREQLDELTRTRSAIFNSAAHDLRGPLYRIRNRIEVLLRRPQPGTPVHELREALRDVEGIQRSLMTLLEIARAESGAPLTDAARLDLSALVHDLVEVFEAEAAEDRLHLVEATRAPVWVHGSRQLLAQLIANLLENAIKYVPAGGTITVSATQIEGGARLVVADDGPGIPAADRLLAIQPFVRLGSAEGTAGSGLGLSLVAAVVRLHGGELSLEDNGPGLRVVVALKDPIAAIAPATTAG